MVTSQGFDMELSWPDKTPRDAQSDLETFLKLANVQTLRIMQNSKEEVVKIARRYVPVRTGKLRDSISGTVRHESGDVSLLVGSPVEYAYYVEFGTGSMSAQPYLRPALEELGPRFNAAMSQSLHEAAKGVR